MTTPENNRWWHFGACREEDVNTWYPELGSSWDVVMRRTPHEQGPINTRAREAKLICSACPVRLICLEEALREEGGSGLSGRYGIRGGLDPNERHRIYKSRMERERKALLRALEQEKEAA